MKFTNVMMRAFFLFATFLVFTSCKKDLTLEDVGMTYVKIMDGGSQDDAGHSFFPIDFITDPQSITLLDIRRDASSNNELNKAMKIEILDDIDALNTYNDALIADGKAPLVHLPESFYKIDESITKTGGDGGIYHVNLKSGEFAKQLSFEIPDATLLDPSTQYALPFTITSVDSYGAISSSNTFIAIIAAKNKYDGRYELNFSNFHPTYNPDYADTTIEVQMWTTAGDKVKINWDGEYGNPALGTDDVVPYLFAFGAQEPEYTIGSDNKVTVQNTASGAVTFYTMNSSYDSHYDPDTKTIYVKWGYRYASPGVFGPTCREWTQTFKYIGPR